MAQESRTTWESSAALTFPTAVSAAYFRHLDAAGLDTGVPDSVAVAAAAAAVATAARNLSLIETSHTDVFVIGKLPNKKWISLAPGISRYEKKSN